MILYLKMTIVSVEHSRSAKTIESMLPSFLRRNLVTKRVFRVAVKNRIEQDGVTE